MMFYNLKPEVPALLKSQFFIEDMKAAVYESESWNNIKIKW